MKKTAYIFHRKVIRPANRRLFEFKPAVGDCDLYDAMAVGGRPKKSTAMKTSAIVVGFSNALQQD